MKRVPLILSCVIVAVAATLFVVHYQQRVVYLSRRNFRLLAVAGRLLADSQGSTNFSLEGHTIRARPIASKDSSDGWTVDPAALLRQVPERDKFDALFVTDPTGTVIARIDMTAGAPRFASIKQLRPVSETGTPFSQALVHSALVESEVGGEVYKFFFQVLDLAPTRMPPTPSPAAPKKGTDPKDEPSRLDALVIGGMVSAARFGEESREISPLTVSVLLALVILTVLLHPIVRLRFLARNDRLSFGNAYALAACTFLGLMLGVTAFLGVSLHSGLLARTDAELESIGEKVKSNLVTELTSITAQLREFDDRLRPPSKLGGPLEARSAVTDRISLLVADKCLTGVPAHCTWPSHASYPFFETVFWAGADGQQIAKWRVSSRPTESISVANRLYFQMVRRGRTWNLAEARGHVGSEPYYLDFVRSLVTGNKRAVVAIPSASASASDTSAKDNHPVMVAATTRLLAIADAVLPPRVSVCIVDDQGNVLYHSTEDLSLSHNLFQETNNDPHLISAIRSGVDASMGVDYWGEGYRVHTGPVPGMPLTVVVMRQDSLIRAATLEAVEDAAILMVLYSVFAFVIPSTLLLSIVGNSLSWLWPDERRIPVYWRLTAAYVCIALAFRVAVSMAHEADCFTVAFILPLWVAAVTTVIFGLRVRPRWLPYGTRFAAILCAGCAVATVAAVSLRWTRTWVGLLATALLVVLLLVALPWTWHWGLSDRPKKGTGVRRILQRRWADALRRRPQGMLLVPYSLAALGFWLVFAILPPAAIFKGAAERSLRELSRNELLWYSRRLADHREALPYAYRGMSDSPTEAPAGFWELSLPEELGVYWLRGSKAGGLFAIEPAPTPPPSLRADTMATLGLGPLDGLAEALTGKKPFINRDAVDLRRLSAVGAGRVEWMVDDQASGSASAPRATWTYLTARSQGRDVSVRGSQMSVGRLLGEAPYGGLAIVAAVLAAWVRWSARHLFFGQLASRRLRPIADFEEGKPGSSICILPTALTLRRLERSGTLQWARLSGSPQPTMDAGRPGPIAVSGAFLSDPDSALRLRSLESIESLISSGARTVYAFCVGYPPPHPLAFAPQPGLSMGELARWSAILDRLVVTAVRAEPPIGRNAALIEARRLLGKESKSYAGLLAREFTGCPALFRACLTLEDEALGGAGWSDVLARLTDLGTPFYWSAWVGCSQTEQLVLSQLAAEGLVNPKQVDAVRLLLDKGLLVRNPSLSPMTRSFAAFIARVENRVEIARLEREGEGFGWSELKLPMATGALAAAFLLFLTQRDLFNSTLILVSAFGASGIPAVVARLASGLPGRTADAKPGASGSA